MEALFQTEKKICRALFMYLQVRSHMGAKLAKSENLFCQLVVFTSLSLLSNRLSIYSISHQVNLRHSTLKLADRITCCNPRDVIYDAMVVYNYDNIRKFLERQLPFLMTNLVLLSSQRDVGPALDFISNQVEKKPKKLLADHFPTIFTKIVTKVRTCRNAKKMCTILAAS